MSKVLIFTNAVSAAQTELYHRFENTYPIAEEPISRFSFDRNNAQLITVKDCKEDGVYLIYDGEKDSNYNSTFDSILSQCTDCNLYVLAHSFPERKNEFLKLGLRKPVIGAHEPGDKNHYYPIFDILTDDKEDKMERIIKILTPLKSKELLNTALQFFDGCMTPRNNDATFIHAYEELLRDEQLSETVRTFYENKYKDNEYTDYLPSLKPVIDNVISILAERLQRERLSQNEN